MQSLGYARDYDETSPAIGRLFDLSGRVAVVTGGGSGIGRAIGLGLARFGADVALVDLNQQAAAAVSAEIAPLGRKVEAYACDVTSWDAVEALAGQVEHHFGQIDICVNSAGGNIRRSGLEATPDEWRWVLDLNLTGSWHIARAFGALMVQRRRGKLINLASIYGHVVIDGNTPYAVSKHAVVGMTRALAVEWAPHNVQVNCLAPTYIRTPLTDPLQQDQAKLADLNQRSPIQRFGEAWELIGPAVFLASDASGLVTGHSLLVDGGWTSL